MSCFGEGKLREGDWLKTARDKGDEDGDGVEGEPTVNVALRRDPVVSGDGVRFALADLGDELKRQNCINNLRY